MHCFSGTSQQLHENIYGLPYSIGRP